MGNVSRNTSYDTTNAHLVKSALGRDNVGSTPIRTAKQRLLKVQVEIPRVLRSCIAIALTSEICG